MSKKKVIFLDVDGVLNSVAYDRERNQNDRNIDVSRLMLLKQIVDATGAEIVLSSTWRMHWKKNDSVAEETKRVFFSAGLSITDITPFGESRREEIVVWLKKNADTERFVIIDDQFGGWGELAPFLIKTDGRIGRGLENNHVRAGIKLLNGDMTQR